MLGAMAWRNLWRQPVRTVLSLLSIAFAAALLVFMLSFQLGVYATMKENTLSLFDGYAQIQPKGYADDPDIRKVIENADTVAASARKVPGISAAAARATTDVILANGDRSYGAAIVGIDPANEIKVTRLPGTIKQGRYLQPSDSDAIVLGDALARDLKLKLGDKVILLGSAFDGTVAADSLKIVGIFATGITDLDRQLAEMPLARFSDTFAMNGAANVIALSGPNLSSVQSARGALDTLVNPEGLTVRGWTKLEPELNQGITIDFSTGLMFYISGGVVVVFIILNTLLMSVLERTREFGMLLAIGMQPGKIGRMLWLELIMLVGLGDLIGILIGGGIAFWFAHQGIAFASLEGVLAQWGLPGRLYPSVSLVSLLSGPVGIFLAVAVAGLIPVRRIRKLEPVAAMGVA
jgi:putative ABC transport system permease protein